MENEPAYGVCCNNIENRTNPFGRRRKKGKKNRPVPGGGGTAQGGFDGSDVTLGVKQATDYLCLIQHGNRYSVPDLPSLSAAGFNTAD